jgi:hypothetical protein
MAIPATKKYSDIPGDTRLVTKESATTVDGRTYPRGTVCQPLAGGYSNTYGANYAEMTIGGERVVFVAR